MFRPIPIEIVIPFVRLQEGEVLRAYDDKRPKVILKPGDQVVGVLTGGVGHPTKNDLTIGMVISKELSAKWLLSDLIHKAAEPIYKKIGDIVNDLTEHQYAALLSFVFNLGTDTPGKPEWTLWQRLRNKEFDQIPLELMKFVNWNGQKSKSLLDRRMREVSLWSTEEPGTTAVDIPSSVTRESPTPPTPADPVPPHKSGTIIAAATAAATSVPAGVEQITKAIAPYADKSEHIQKVVSLLALVGAIATVVVLVLVYLNKRKNRN